MDDNCELCRETGGILLWDNPRLRIVRVADADYPGFCRVIWKEHVREMTDLPPADRSLLMKTVCVTEQVVRTLFAPHKINLASLGNMTPHLHWHIIPRWADDRHFPQPIWATPQRKDTAARPEVTDDQLRAALLIHLASHSESKSA